MKLAREIAELLHVNHVTVKNLLEKPPRWPSGDYHPWGT